MIFYVLLQKFFGRYGKIYDQFSHISFHDKMLLRNSELPQRSRIGTFFCELDD